VSGLLVFLSPIFHTYTSNPIPEPHPPPQNPRDPPRDTTYYYYYTYTVVDPPEKALKV